MTPVAVRIRARLSELGLSASGASLLAGLSRSAVTDILSGASESPRLDTLEKLCGPLKCSIHDLVAEPRERASVPIEVKPFESAIAARQISDRGWILTDLAGETMATVTGDADRVEEIVRLINASVLNTADAPSLYEGDEQAFPGGYLRDQKGRGPVVVFSPGLTKREWLAGQAAAGMMADPAFRGDDFATLCAEQAFMVADALLAKSAKAVRS